MPKDLIHFRIAELTAEHLSDTPYSEHCQRCPEGVLLGSVFHDALFYLTGKVGETIHEIPDTLHGADGEDTFALIRLQATHARASLPLSPPVALLVGMVSHIFADITFHPMVWHLTGNYYAADPAERSLAIRRHRAMETLMDMALCADMLGKREYRIKGMLQLAGPALDKAWPVADLAGAFGLRQQRLSRIFHRAFQRYAKAQSYFMSPLLARFAGALYSVLPPGKREVAALFYAPQINQQLPQLSGPIHYRHPITGDSRQGTLADLATRAARLAADMLIGMQPALFDGEPFEINDTGPSLDTGEPGKGTVEIEHYATEPFSVYE